MNRSLAVGTVITLKSGERETEFTVLEVLGEGGGCIAYDVSYTEDSGIPHRGVLKECCPFFLTQDSCFHRENNSLNISPKYEPLFIKELERFKQTYKSITNYLYKNVSASNFHTVQIGMYEGNNTLYTLVSKDYGKSYDKVEDESILSIIKIALSATKAVEQYHKSGFVHLDIKPKNIFILDEVTDLVKLFDFDSLTSISDLKQRKVQAIPIPEDYYVPELANGEIRSVGIQTDIFEIGAMVFQRLFGRGCVSEDLTYDKHYNFDGVQLLTGVSPQVKFELEVFFKNTLQISQRRRYKTVEELKTQLNKIVKNLDSKTPYLLNLPKWNPSSFSIGRQKELVDIKTMLDKDGFVFVKAMGGTGKSELSKLFAQKYAAEYHTVQFCKYGDSLKTLVASMPFGGLDDGAYQNFDDLLKEKNKLLHLCEGNTLLIVDNFNVTYDEFMRDFLPSDNKSFKVIFTTRCTQAASYYEKNTYNLQNLSFDECKTVYEKHTSAPLLEEEMVVFEDLMNTIGYNALVLTLLASTVRATGMKLSDVCNSIHEQELESVETKVFHEYDFESDEVETYNKINSHLKTIFSISGLSDSEKEALKVMTLVASCGIEKSDILHIRCITEAIADKLINYGWIEVINSRITMHSIVSDLIANEEAVKKSENYYVLADFIAEKCTPDSEAHITVVTNNIAYAIHLERRFKNEPVKKRTDIKIKIGRLYHILYRPQEARNYLSQALEMSDKKKELCSVCQIYHYLGCIEKNFGTETKALEYFQKSVNIGKSFKARCYDAVLDSAIESAEIYIENHKLDKAYAEYKYALKFAKNHFRKSYIHKIYMKLSEISQDLGLIVKAKKYKKQGEKHEKYAKKDKDIPEFENAEEMMDRADTKGLRSAYEAYLNRMREQLGEDSPTYMTLTREEWAFALINGDREEAMRSIAKILDFIETAHGKESMEMAKMLDFLAASVTFLRDADYATKCALKAIEICKKNHEEDSYVFTSARLHLAYCYHYAGKSKKLLEIIDEIDFSKFRGKDVMEDAVFNLGLALCDLDKFREAEILAKSVLKRDDISTGVKVIAEQMLTNIYTGMADIDLAEKHLERMKKQIDVLGEHYYHNKFTFSYYRCRSKIAYAKTDYSGALNDAKESLNYIEKIDPEPEQIAICHSDMGLFLYSLGSNNEAEKEYDTAKEILDNAKSAPEYYTVLYNNYASMFLERGEHEKAYDYYEKAIRCSVVDSLPTTFFEALLLCNMGCVLIAMDRYEEAIPYLQTSKKGFETINCEKRSEYFLTIYLLSLALSELEDYAEAFDNACFLYENFDKYEYYGNEDEYKKLISIVCIKSLLGLERYREAYKVAVETAEHFIIKLGSDSLFYIDTVSEIGSLFQCFSREECLEFFNEALECVAEGNYEITVSNATLINYIGVYLTNMEENHSLAKEYFEKSKMIFEELNETDNETYRLVLGNIEYCQELISND